MGYHTQCTKIKLKPNSLERVREWAKTLNDTRRAEAMAALRDETVVLEGAFLDRTAEGDFLIYIMKAKSFEKSKQAAAASTHDIDRYHQDFKRSTWEGGKQLEVLVDLDRIDELSGIQAGS
jgi:hypothetical protein